MDLAKQFNDIPDDLEGVLVDTVVRGELQDIAGIDAATTNKYGERQSGDVITALDGNNIVDIEGLLSYVQEDKTIGEAIVFTVYRNGRIFESQCASSTHQIMIINSHHHYLSIIFIDFIDLFMR